MAYKEHEKKEHKKHHEASMDGGAKPARSSMNPAPKKEHKGGRKVWEMESGGKGLALNKSPVEKY